jgi:hypothetical protein
MACSCTSRRRTCLQHSALLGPSSACRAVLRAFCGPGHCGPAQDIDSHVRTPWRVATILRAASAQCTLRPYARTSASAHALRSYDSSSVLAVMRRSSSRGKMRSSSHAMSSDWKIVRASYMPYSMAARDNCQHHTRPPSAAEPCGKQLLCGKVPRTDQDEQDYFGIRTKFRGTSKAQRANHDVQAERSSGRLRACLTNFSSNLSRNSR